MTARGAFESISGSGDDFAQVVTACESLRDYCLIGGLVINCFVEPVYTMDADFALAAAHLPVVRERLQASGFTVEDHPHSLNALRAGSVAHSIHQRRALRGVPVPRRISRDTRIKIACGVSAGSGAGEGLGVERSTTETLETQERRVGFDSYRGTISPIRPGFARGDSRPVGRVCVSAA